MISFSKIFIIFIFTLGKVNADLFNFSNNILDNNIKEYEQYLQKYKIISRYNQHNISQKQELLGKVLKYAKKLFIMPSNSVLKQMTDSIYNCCKYVESNLKKQKNITNKMENKLKVFCNFVQTGMKLLNEFANTTDDRYICNLIILCPDMIPCLAKEFNVIMNIGGVLVKDYRNVNKSIQIINRFVASSDENTYLLSTIFTLAINSNMSLEQILKSKDVSNKQICKYLDWQVSN